MMSAVGVFSAAVIAPLFALVVAMSVAYPEGDGRRGVWSGSGHEG